MQQYQIKEATEAEELLVKEVFLAAAREFELADTFLASLLVGTICNYSESHGRGFGLGALRVGTSIYVTFNKARSQSSKFEEVKAFIVERCGKIFGDRFSASHEHELLDLAAIPRHEVSKESRQFVEDIANRPKPVTPDDSAST